MNMQMWVHIGLLYFVKKKNEIIYFDSFGVEYIPNEIKEFIKKFPGNKNRKINIFRVPEGNSIMCGYFCIGFRIFCIGLC